MCKNIEICFDRTESKPKKNPANYTVKAQTFGYRGEREHFNTVQRKLENESSDFLSQLTHYKAFQSVKCILDSVTVAEETY